MNIKNLEFLKDNLKYMGFGDKLNAELETKITQQPGEFSLSTENEFRRGEKTEKMQFSLDFRKSDKSDMYFFNRYRATLKNEDPSKDIAQTFYIAKNTGITAKEAFNLLSGRSVNKDLLTKDEQPFNAWLKLELGEPKDNNDNFKVKQFHQSYGFDLEKTLANYAIKELTIPELKDRVVKSLMKGNTTLVTITRDGQDHKMYIDANPQFKNLTVYDSNLKKEFQQNEKQNTREPSEATEKKNEVKKDDQEDNPAKGKKRNRGVGV